MLSGSKCVQAFVIVCLYLYCRWKSTYQEERVKIQITGFNRGNLSVCFKPRPRFLLAQVVVFIVSNDLRLEVIVRFVDIVGIIDHICLNFIFRIVEIYVFLLQTCKCLSIIVEKSQHYIFSSKHFENRIIYSFKINGLV
jgi:hypothetical protein